MLVPAISLLIIVLVSVSSAPIPFDGVLRTSSDGSVYAFLDPPRGGNHAATIEVLPSGSLGLAWFTGGEGTPNCSIAFSLLPLGAPAWTAGVIVAEHTNYSDQNPVLLYDASADLLRLYHTSQDPSSGESSSSIWHTSSSDGGVTFPPAVPLFTVPGAFTRNRIIPSATGEGFIFPIYNSTPGTLPDYPIMLLGSDSLGWTPVRAPGADLIQPTVIRLPKPTGGGSFLRAWLRNENQTVAYVMDSVDDGMTWSEPAPTTLSNNNAALQAIVLQSGAVAIVYDDQTGPSTPRSPLVIALSYDGGLTFPINRALQVHDDNQTLVEEYSYPTLLQTQDGSIHVAYTYGRLTIKYVRFKQSWIEGR